MQPVPFLTVLGLSLAGATGLALVGQDTEPRAREASAPRVDEVLAGWPEVSRAAARATMESYGPPDGVTDVLLLWEDTGPWARTVVYRDPVQHDFPKPHQDVLEQWVGYAVPADRFDELAQYDGSVICERTKGVISARCDKEPMNFLALNLAHAIVQGDLSVDEARRTYAETVAQVMQGESPDITQGLQFEPQPDAGDPDQPVQAGGGR